MYIGYNTNGFAHHRLEDAIVILSELGYEGVAITMDYHALNPFEPDYLSQVHRVRNLLERNQLCSMIETGSRFLLNPRKKHSPTLMDSTTHQDIRIRFLRSAMELAAELGSDGVSFWSGALQESLPTEKAMQHLVEACKRLCGEAERKSVRLAFEPEPGMFIDRMDRFAELHQKVNHPLFGLTLDVGHLHCQNELPIADSILRWKDYLWNIHIEDMKSGIHDHLPFGEGEMDFAPIFQALQQIHYQAGLFVELSRHSHNAVETARQAIGFLNEKVGK